MATVYEINKGINRSLEFKGIKAQYIIYLAVGMVLLLLLFAIMYAIGLNMYICMGVLLSTGGGFIAAIQRLSNKYGEYGLQKKMAARQLPGSILSRSRKIFINLKKQSDAKDKNNRRSNAHI